MNSKQAILWLAFCVLPIASVSGFEMPWWLDEARVVSDEPGSSTLHLSGVWSDGCVPDRIDSARDNGDLFLTIEHPGINVGCPEVLTEWSLTHEFDSLPDPYAVFGSFYAVDPQDRKVRQKRSGPDLIAVVSNRRRSVFHGLGNPDKNSVSEAWDVSADGSVVVGANRWFAGAPEVSSEAFVWDATNGVRPLGFLPNGIPGGSRAYGVSADGANVVGHSAANDFGKSFQWNATNKMQVVPPLTEVSESTAYAASQNAQYIVGKDEAFFPGVPGSDSRRAYRWSAETGTVDLGVIHERGGTAARDVSVDGQRVAGNAFEPRYDESGEVLPLANLSEPFLWTEGSGMVSLGHLPYFIDIDIAFDYFRDSRANGISADGTTVVGYSAIVPESLNLGLQLRTKAFRYTDEEGLVDLGHVPAYGLIETKAVDVSADGSVIVGMNEYDLPPEVDAPPNWLPQKPFIWDERKGMRLLETVVDNELGLSETGDLDGWQLYTVSAISDDGRTLVGTGINPAGDLESWRLVLDHDYGPGDANLDGVFDSADLVQVFEAGEYEDRFSLNSSWATGDWNDDAEFDSSDLVTAFQAGNYEQNSPAVVPEPTSNVWTITMLLIAVFCRKRSSN